MIACIAFGTRGDVQPVACICEHLRRNHHQRPVLITHQAHATWLAAVPFGKLETRWVQSLPWDANHLEKLQRQETWQHVQELHAMQHEGHSSACRSKVPAASASTSIAASHLEHDAPSNSTPKHCKRTATGELKMAEHIRSPGGTQGLRCLAFTLFACEGFHIAEKLKVPCVCLSPYPMPAACPSFFRSSFPKKLPQLYAMLTGAGLHTNGTGGSDSLEPQPGRLARLAPRTCAGSTLVKETERATREEEHRQRDPGGSGPYSGRTGGSEPQPGGPGGLGPYSDRTSGSEPRPDQAGASQTSSRGVTSKEVTASDQAGVSQTSPGEDCVTFKEVAAWMWPFWSSQRWPKYGEVSLHLGVIARALCTMGKYAVVLTSSSKKVHDAHTRLLSAHPDYFLDASHMLLLQEPVPHQLLFPYCSVVLHPGGSGTTAAALLAGLPQLFTPLHYDQPFWAERLSYLGLAPPPLDAALLFGGRKKDVEAAEGGQGREDALTHGPAPAPLGATFLSSSRKKDVEAAEGGQGRADALAHGPAPAPTPLDATLSFESRTLGGEVIGGVDERAEDKEIESAAEMLCEAWNMATSPEVIWSCKIMAEELGQEDGLEI
eukprot:gene6183-2799_t